MPPGPAYNWLCVASSLVDILSHSAQVRAAQLARNGAALGTDNLSRKRKRTGAYPDANHSATVVVKSALTAAEDASLVQERNSVPPPCDIPPDVTLPKEQTVPATADAFEYKSQKHPENAKRLTSPGRRRVPPSTPRALAIRGLHKSPEQNSSFAGVDQTPSIQTSSIHPHALPSLEMKRVEVPLVGDLAPRTDVPETEEIVLDPPRTRTLQSSKVPSSRIGRLFHYGGLAASLGYGMASELVRRSTSSSDENVAPSLMLTEGNIKRLVSKLTQMRGAALKLGQFMSIQDSHVLPPEVEDIFRRVQDSAHYMPDWQMEKVMQDSLGPSWMTNFESFDRLPFAAASIGQVHSAVLAASASPTGKPEPVAVKVQFPNIVHSMDSDIGYVKMLLTAGRLLPPGLFLERTIQVMKEEMAEECDYTREASFLRRFGEGLERDERFKVPWVWDGSTKTVLVMEKVDGISVGGSVINKLSQRDRDDIAVRIVDLCLRELFVLRLMQTDPNWTNFLWNRRTRKVELVDFGATREYSKEFIDGWLRLLSAAVDEDRDACVEWSRKIGYLTGEENEVMVDAHVRSMVLLGTPFRASTAQPFRFGRGSSWADITGEIRAQIPVMLQHRLTPPPRETYSLNRKLSGAFLLASRLNASVDCRTLWKRVTDGYRFE